LERFNALHCFALLALKLFIDCVFARFGVSRGEIGFTDAALLRPLDTPHRAQMIEKGLCKGKADSKDRPRQENLNKADCISGEAISVSGRLLTDQGILRFNPISTWPWPLRCARIKIKTIGNPAWAGD
jgi:hypothetical protein